MRSVKLMEACVALLLPAIAAAQPKSPMQFPDAPGREVVQKVCGVCHGAEVVVAEGLTRQEWGQVIASMVTRGAKGSDEEFGQVLNYLTTNFPPKPAGAATTVTVSRRRGGGAGPDDVQMVDAAAADRGRTTYIAECITCHGPKARGKDGGGPDLVRSLTILHDRYGSTIGSFLKNGHPMQSGHASTSLTQAQIADLSHFLHQRVNDTLRSGPYSKVINVLTGDAKAGAAYFHGAGKCDTCHAANGDLASIATKYDAPTLQQRFLFPQSVGFGRRGAVAGSKRATLTVTVTPPSGPAVTGVPLSLDDFNVSLRDDAGQYHAWKRTPDLKVEKHDPYAAHVAMLDQISDKNIHDVVAYLETLK
ncbi:MAG TPA: cytochrome C [Solibacterales bacterium]|nr:cytochrome C [Bryobacterales bacterium]